MACLNEKPYESVLSLSSSQTLWLRLRAKKLFVPSGNVGKLSSYSYDVSALPQAVAAAYVAISAHPKILRLIISLFLFVVFLFS